jgi:polyphosphate kinase 2
MSTVITELSSQDLELLNSKEGVLELLRYKNTNIERSLRRLHYLKELEKWQIELIKMQNWVEKKKKRLAILFEGRDAAGKGGAIRRFTEHLNPRLLRVVALPHPTPVEKGQWYFQRYVQQLPNPGEIVFFDRSWYNRAVVEPVNGFCSKKQYKEFMSQVVDFENMLHKDGIQIIKLWFSITQQEQERRFEQIEADPLKVWKMSPVDDRALELWEDYTMYKEDMFIKTNMEFSPWQVVKADNKPLARLEAIKYVLNEVDYPKTEETLRDLEIDKQILYRLQPGQTGTTSG